MWWDLLHCCHGRSSISSGEKQKHSHHIYGRIILRPPPPPPYFAGVACSIYPESSHVCCWGAQRTQHHCVLCIVYLACDDLTLHVNITRYSTTTVKSTRATRHSSTSSLPLFVTLTVVVPLQLLFPFRCVSSNYGSCVLCYSDTGERFWCSYGC